MKIMRDQDIIIERQRELLIRVATDRKKLREENEALRTLLYESHDALDDGLMIVVKCNSLNEVRRLYPTMRTNRLLAKIKGLPK